MVLVWLVRLWQRLIIRGCQSMIFMADQLIFYLDSVSQIWIITNLFNESIGSCLPSRTLCTKENFSCSVSCCRGLRTLSCAPSQRSKRWSSWAARWSSRVYKEFLIKLELTDLANHIIYTYYIQYCFSWLAQWCMQSTAGLAQWNLMKVRVQKGCYLG